uniref:Uncharacterized protein n=1 Tax=Lygus hesperus TaxID=30085 RepID=A0A0A9YRE2_LYGHE
MYECRHASDVRPERCASAQHAIEKNHGFDFDVTEILDREPVLGRCLFKEMTYIHLNPRSCNTRELRVSVQWILEYFLRFRRSILAVKVFGLFRSVLVATYQPGF